MTRAAIYTTETIALVKGIYACGVSVKQIAKATHIPMACVASWCYNRRKTEIAESPEPGRLLADLYQKVLYTFRAENVDEGEGFSENSRAQVRPE